MEESGKSAVNNETTEGAVPADGGKRRRLPVYALSACAVLVAAGAIYLATQQPAAVTPPVVKAEAAAPAPAAAARVVIDEAATIRRVMTENYGKYSEEQQGWPYVDENGQTYVMRVVQQARLTDGDAGDELYFLASGDGTQEDHSGKLGAFHVRPDPDKPGALVTIGLRDMHGGVEPPSTENTDFVSLSPRLRAWVISVREGIDGEDYLKTDRVVLAPDGKRIVALATFPAWRHFTGFNECGHLDDSGAPRAAGDTAGEAPAPGEAVMNEEDMGVGGYLCQERTWKYRIGASQDGVPAPISVTAGGYLDGTPVAAETWQLVFDPKAFRYKVPADLKPDGD